MDFELVAGVSAVVVIIGIIEALKGIFNLEPKYAPIVAVALGLIASLGLTYYGDTEAFGAIIRGLAVGLSAVGLHSGSKNVVEKYKEAKK